MNRKYVDTSLTISNGGRAQSWWIGRKTTGVRTNFTSGSSNQEIDLVELIQRYNLSGFEFGNWLNQSDRYDMVIATAESLADLAKIMGTRNIGLDGAVGIAFGARGRTRAKAHYEPSTNMINLTKEKGIGSLAHELAHALDYIFGRHVDRLRAYSGITGWDSTAKQCTDNVGGQLRHYANLVVDEVKASESYKRLDGSAEYWHRRNEIFARTFEQWVSAKLHKAGRKNVFLAKLWYQYITESAYLKEADFKRIEPHMDKLVAEMALLLNNKGKVRSMPYPIRKTIAKPMKTAADKKKMAATITKNTNKVHKLTAEEKRVLEKKAQNARNRILLDKKVKLLLKKNISVDAKQTQLVSLIQSLTPLGKSFCVHIAVDVLSAYLDKGKYPDFRTLAKKDLDEIERKLGIKKVATPKAKKAATPKAKKTKPKQLTLFSR